MQNISPQTKQGFLKRFLDPIDRLTEAIYAVLIVMTFTMAYRAIDVSTFNAITPNAVSQAVTQLALAAFGCAVAWGIIDGAMFVLLSMLERGETNRLLKRVKSAPDEQAGVAAIAGQLDGTLGDIMTDDERNDIYRQAYQRMRDNTPQQVGFKREEFYGALGVLLIAIFSTLPVVLPMLLFSSNVNLALRMSNLMAIFMLFIFGYEWAKYAGSNRIKVGLLLAGLGVAMVLIAIPLGG